MLYLTLIILIGVGLIHGKMWKMTAEQRCHNEVVERILTEIRDGRQSIEAGETTT